MIRSHRRRHQRLFTVFAVVIPSLLVTTIWFRPAVPPAADIDPLLKDQAGFSSPQEWQPQVVSSGTFEFEVQALTGAATDETAIVIRPRTAILKPDLLVYWAANAAVSDALSEDAVLVGRLSGTSRRKLPLPTAARAGSGAILIYSLAHHEMVAHFPLQAAMANAKSGG